MIKKSLKYTLYTLGIISILLMLLGLFTQSQWFRDMLKLKAITLIQKELNIKLELQSIEGNLINQVHLTQLKAKLKDDDSSLIEISSLHLKYDLWKLLNKQIYVDSIVINKSKVHLLQDEDGSWNLSRIMPPSQTPKPEIKKAFPYSIKANNILLKNMQASIESGNAIISQNIEQLNLRAAFFYDSSSIQTQVHHLSLNSDKLNIKQLSGQFSKEGSQLRLDSLYLNTTHSLIQGEASYAKLKNSFAQINTNPLNNKELELFIPSIHLPHSPHITANFSTKGDTTDIKLDLSIPSESLSISASLFKLHQYVQDNHNKIPFEASLRFNQVKPENWWSLDTTQICINGNATIKGDHLLNYKDHLNFSGDLSNSKFGSNTFRSLALSATQTQNKLIAHISSSSNLGRVAGTFNIDNIYSTPSYEASIQTDSLLLSSIVPGLDSSLINSEIHLSGEHFNLAKLRLKSNIQLQNSLLYKLPVDSAVLQAKLENNTIHLLESKIMLSGIKLFPKGNYQIKSTELNTNINFEFDHLDEMDAFSVPELEFKTATGHINANGTLDSLLASGQIRVEQFNGFSVECMDFESDLSASYINQKLNGNAKLKALAISGFNLHLDTLQSQVAFNNSIIHTNTFAAVDSITTTIEARAEFNDSLSFNISKLELNSPHASYFIADTSNSIHIYDNNISINRLLLKDRNFPDFELKANGRISSSSPEDFELSINNFHLITLKRLNLIPDLNAGLFSIQMKLHGDPGSPILESFYTLREGQYKEMRVPELNGDINFSDQNLRASLNLTQLQDRFNVQFTSPVTAKFDSSAFTFKAPETFASTVTIDSINISEPIENHQSQISTSGILSTQLEARGRFDQPAFYGFFKLNEGKFKDEDIGIEAQDITIAINLDSNKVAIDTFMVKREKGYLAIHGEAAFDSSMISGKIHSSTLEADAKAFYLTRHKNYEILIDANTFIKALDKNQEFGGKVKVIRSDFYLPAFIDSDDEDDFEDVPLLVEAIGSEPDSSNISAEKEEAPLKRKQSNFMKTLTGRLQLEIPRNTWLKSEEMKIEIWGDLEIEKSSSFFELFGEVGINRGHYILYGKKLNIKEGNISFQGGEDIDPILDFKANYTYRGSDKQKRELELQVSDRLSEPTINFTLDNTPIPDADAVSILLFGKTMDELSYAGQNGIVGSMGSNMLAQMVTSQLSKTLGTRFNLDMIEVNATENWQSAAFVVGKYITNDLFVIYQRGFGETEGDEITPETITLEYELNRILFFRLQSGSSKDSGFDVILKFESNKD